MSLTTTTDYAERADRVLDVLDALVAERVMGWRYEPLLWEDVDGGMNPGWAHPEHEDLMHAFPPAHYASTWEGAGLVLEAMRAKGWAPEIDTYIDGDWVVSFGRWLSAVRAEDKPTSGPSLPRAVCIAALRALDAEAAS